jgi:hypothetical protein
LFLQLLEASGGLAEASDSGRLIGPLENQTSADDAAAADGGLGEAPPARDELLRCPLSKVSFS